MASDAMMQAIGRLERALSKVEGMARQIAETRAIALDEQVAAMDAAEVEDQPVDIDPFSRDKAIAALKSLDALIGDLKNARSDA